MLIQNSIANYLKFNVITEPHIVYASAMTFPQVTFCKDNKNPNNDFRVARCLFDRVDCKDSFDLVDVYDDYGGTRQCLRFNGGKIIYYVIEII